MLKTQLFDCKIVSNGSNTEINSGRNSNDSNGNNGNKKLKKN